MFFKKFNDRLGNRLSYWLTTMGMFYVVCIFVLAPLLWQRPQGLVSWMQYAMAVFFQGAALPLLGYVSRKSGEKQEKIISETHDAVMVQLCLIKKDLAYAKQQQEELNKLIDNVNGQFSNNNTHS